VLVSARRLHDLGIVDTDQEAPRLVEETTRALSAPELTAMAASGPAAAPELAAPEHPAAATAVTGEPGEPAGSLPERSHGADADRGSSSPELVMTHINGAAQ